MERHGRLVSLGEKSLTKYMNKMRKEVDELTALAQAPVQAPAQAPPPAPAQPPPAEPPGPDTPAAPPGAAPARKITTKAAAAIFQAKK